MDNQVIQLKKKVKTLQKQLCDRTRNYLYHFKKSPVKLVHPTTEQQSQTECIEELIEDMTQTQIEQDNHFANVNLQKFDNCSSDSSPDDKNLKLQQKRKFNLTLDLNDERFQNDLRQENQKHKGQIDNLALEIRLMKQQLQNSKTPRNKHQMKFEFLQTPQITYTPVKENGNMQLSKNSNMQFSKKRQIQTIEEQSDMKSNCSTNHRIIEYDHLSKEIKIMKKQIKKLKALLQHEVQASTQTKEALLISEQENYKFRLKIQRLNKEIQILTGASTDSEVDRYEKPLIFQVQQPALSSIDSEKSQSTREQLEKFRSQAEKYEQHIFILQGVKRDYLKKCIQAKEEIYRLKQQNQKLKGQVIQLKTQTNNSQQERDGQKNQFLSDKFQGLETKQMQNQWSQVFKCKIHQISNCLPVGDNQQMFLFKPDTLEDLISMLDRILMFCKNIQSWEKQRIQTIQKERANLLRVMSAILMRHPETKQALAEEILQIDELKYLVNFLNKQPKTNKFSKIFMNFDNLQISPNDSEPIETS